MLNNNHAPFNNPLVRFLTERRFRWMRHAFFILVGLLLAFKGDVGGAGDHRAPQLQNAILIVDAVTFISIMGIIYFMLLVLVPKLLFRSKILLFAVSFFALVTLVYFVVWYADHTYLKPLDNAANPQMQHIDLSLVAFVQTGAVAAVLLGAVVGLVTFKKWIKDVQHMNELQAINLRTELEQLKSQVNPHFLFNTLNNLLVLVKTDAEKASQVLLGLSDLLRYQLYDSSREKILLSKDINFIENLLSLEKIRKTDFDYTIRTRGNIESIALPPFLFIPFVENAIKHGASTVGHSYLELDFCIDDGKLHFTARNSKPAIKKNGIGGIGLKNITRRLELLYPGKHQLLIKDESTDYTANLIIPV